MNQDLPEVSSPVSGGRFYLRLFFAAILVVGGLTLLVWYTNR